MIRSKISEELKNALKAKDQPRVDALRLIIAALKKKDIDARAQGIMDGVDEGEVLSTLQSMIKQRRESIELYEKGNRPELSKKEQAEISVIQGFLPQPLSDQDLDKALEEALFETGAQSIKDMGRIMAFMKGKYAGRIDFSNLAPKVKVKMGG